MSDTARWVLIVVVAVLVIAMLAFARGDESERSTEALSPSVVGTLEV